MARLGRILVEGKVSGEGLRARFSLEISRFQVRISSGRSKITLKYNPPLIVLDISASLRRALSAIDYARFSWLLIKFSRDLKRNNLTLVAKHYGKTFLMVGKKGI